ncbi:MAG: hypothetical protein ACRDD1_19645, partial [Planctomycetia bacterium]
AERTNSDEDPAALRVVRPAVELLLRAGPPNGIDLVPRWQGLLAAAAKEASKIPHSPRLIQAPPPRQGFGLRYAGVLTAGVALGLMLGLFGGSARPAASAAACDYSPPQQELLFAVLDHKRPAGDAVLRRAAVELAGCVVCHDALRPRLAAVLP